LALAVPVRLGQEDLGGFNVTMQQAAFVSMVQGGCDPGGDGTDFFDRHSLGIPFTE
jgi:hypothetical protein